MSATLHPPAARWNLVPPNPVVEEVLRRELGITHVVAALLAQRGIDTPAAAERFLRSSLDDLHPAHLLPDYVPARDAILGAKERGELIYVHGDYDVDGVTSAAMYDRFLRKIGANVVTHVPHRMREGYGIHQSAVDAAIAAGAKLFLTCDCGSSALEQVARAREAGMTVVITDHHTFGDELPDAQAFVNPHRDDSPYPFRELSGAGVAFKLCAGLTEELGIDQKFFYQNFLDLAVLGTVADVMPLVDENRIIVKHGLGVLRRTKKVGLQALMAKAEIAPSKVLSTYDIGFVLGPRLNATGRIDDAEKALRLLVESDPLAAEELATMVEIANTERRAEQNRIIEEAIEIVLRDELHKNHVIIVAQPGWHTGVVGIVASRLVEEFHRPAFVMTIDETTGMVKGSARSIPNFHLAEAIRSMPELMSGGGHAMAAGGAFPVDHLGPVRAAMHERADAMLSEDDFVPRRTVDLELPTAQYHMDLAEELSILEPFGVQNPTPVFLARGMEVVEKSPCRNPQHVRLKLRQGQDRVLKYMAFGMGDRLEPVPIGSKIDVLYKSDINEFRGMRELNPKIDDFAASE